MKSDWKLFDYSEMSVDVKRFESWVLISDYSSIDIRLIMKKYLRDSFEEFYWQDWLHINLSPRRLSEEEYWDNVSNSSWSSWSSSSWSRFRFRIFAFFVSILISYYSNINHLLITYDYVFLNWRIAQMQKFVYMSDELLCFEMLYIVQDLNYSDFVLCDW